MAATHERRPFGPEQQEPKTQQTEPFFKGARATVEGNKIDIELPTFRRADLDRLQQILLGYGLPAIFIAGVVMAIASNIK